MTRNEMVDKLKKLRYYKAKTKVAFAAGVSTETMRKWCKGLIDNDDIFKACKEVIPAIEKVKAERMDKRLETVLNTLSTAKKQAI